MYLSKPNQIVQKAYIILSLNISKYIIDITLVRLCGRERWIAEWLTGGIKTEKVWAVDIRCYDV